MDEFSKRTIDMIEENVLIPVLNLYVNGELTVGQTGKLLGELYLMLNTIEENLKDSEDIDFYTIDVSVKTLDRLKLIITKFVHSQLKKLDSVNASILVENFINGLFSDLNNFFDEYENIINERLDYLSNVPKKTVQVRDKIGNYEKIIDNLSDIKYGISDILEPIHYPNLKFSDIFPNFILLSDPSKVSIIKKLRNLFNELMSNIKEIEQDQQTQNNNDVVINEDTDTDNTSENYESKVENEEYVNNTDLTESCEEDNSHGEINTIEEEVNVIEEENTETIETPDLDEDNSVFTISNMDLEKLLNMIPNIVTFKGTSLSDIKSFCETLQNNVVSGDVNKKDAIGLVYFILSQLILFNDNEELSLELELMNCLTKLRIVSK